MIIELLMCIFDIDTVHHALSNIDVAHIFNLLCIIEVIYLNCLFFFVSRAENFKKLSLELFLLV